MDRMTEVYLTKCETYSHRKLCNFFEQIASPLGLREKLQGSRVLLKPNLISGSGQGLACTHPELMVSLAQWCLDNGARVSLGDSPAFGSSEGVLRKLGVYQTLERLGVNLVEFSSNKEVILDCGVKVGIASALDECDLFVNLPKIKAHSQMYVTIAVKNLFGIVTGLRKPMLHMQYGDLHSRFARIIVDLLEQLPENVTLVDGVQVMHKTGPVNGEGLLLGCLAASLNPVALDVAIMNLLGLDCMKNPLLVEASRRNLVGGHEAKLSYPVLAPEAFTGVHFKAPDKLAPVRFSALRFLRGQMKRFVAKMAG